MSKFVIEGGKKLSGQIYVNGSKNAALPLLASSLLTKDEVEISNVPEVTDVKNLLKIIETLGAQVNQRSETVKIKAKDINSGKLSGEIVGKLRGSILLIGALLGREKEVHLPQPGGDIIGARPIDTHLDAFKQLGAKVIRDRNMVHIDGSDMRAGKVVLREFSVTATENIVLAAATLTGTTKIHVAAGEPHIVILAEILRQMGAEIEGAGTHVISIKGNPDLQGAKIVNIPDMLEAGLFILMAAAAKSEIDIYGAPIDCLNFFFKKLDDIGIKYTVDRDRVRVEPSWLKSFSIQTMPYPGMATDLQAPFAVVATQANGTTLIHDPMYENRFRHCDELVKMGAVITVCDPHRVVIDGPQHLYGQHIKSLDIRSGATLIMAALVAEGESVIEGAEIIDRGYAGLVERLQAIGADIRRVPDSYNKEKAARQSEMKKQAIVL